MLSIAIINRTVDRELFARVALFVAAILRACVAYDWSGKGV
jgi:hypothetical protein